MEGTISDVLPLQWRWNRRPAHFEHNDVDHPPGERLMGKRFIIVLLNAIMHDRKRNHDKRVSHCPRHKERFDVFAVSVNWKGLNGAPVFDFVKGFLEFRVDRPL